MLDDADAGPGSPAASRMDTLNDRRVSALVEFRYHFPGWPQKLGGRGDLMALYAGYGDNIMLHDANELIVHRCQDPRIVILEYEVHGKAVATGGLAPADGNPRPRYQTQHLLKERNDGDPDFGS